MRHNYLSGGEFVCVFVCVIVFVISAGDSRFALQRLSVVQIFDFIDPDEPVLGGKRFLQVLQLHVFVSDLSVSRSVESWRSSEVQLNREEHV